MNKADLSKKLAKELGIPVTEANAIVSTITDTITESLANGEKISIRDFGTLDTYDTKETNRRVPGTGELIKVPSKKRVRFKAGAKLIEAAKESDEN